MNKANQAACPKDGELQQFVAGRLPSIQTEDLARHVEHCEHCQQRMERLDESVAEPDDGVLAEQPLPFADESECGRAVGRVAGVEHHSEGSGSNLPSRLGDYDLLSPLGEGGMGTVYEARHVTLGNLAAIKILRPDRQADPVRIERFGREMVALGRLDHPNIVRALDAGEESGVHYLVMEYVEGLDLGRLAQQRNRLAVADACEAVRQAALGLAYVHRHGRVHRDVKPSNLMLSADGSVKLLDLGLAQVEEYVVDESADQGLDDILGQPTIDLTRTHQVMGTLEYMAPEQAIDSRSVDYRADIYSLGCTFYKLLTGSSPFATTGSITAMSQLVAHVQRPVPSVVNFRSDVPRPVAELLERMLAKDPQQRPASAQEIAEALAPFSAQAELSKLATSAEMDSGPDTVGRTGPTLAVSKPVPTVVAPRLLHVAVVSLLVLVPLALVSCLGIWWWMANPPEGVLLVQRSPGAASAQTSPEVTLIHRGTGREFPLEGDRLLLPLGDYEVKSATQEWTLSTNQFSLGRGDQFVLRVEPADTQFAESPPAGSDSASDEPPVTRTPLPPVDLVALLDADRDILGDTWKIANGALLSDASVPSVLQIPYRPPHQYRLEATVERLEWNESLQLGLVADGQPLTLIVDGFPYEGFYTGIYQLDSKGVQHHGVSRRGMVLPMNQPVRLTATVQAGEGRVAVRLDADGRELISWRGSSDRLGTGTLRGTDPSALFLGNWTAALKVTDFQVVPLAPGGEVIEFSDPQSHPDRAAAERVVWNGGVVTLSLPDEAGNVTPAAGRPQGLLPPTMPDIQMELSRQLTGHTGPIKSIAIAHDGKRAASGSGWPKGDKTVRVWDLDTGEPLHVFTGHSANVMNVAFTPDDRFVLSGDQSGRVLLWNLERGELEVELPLSERRGIEHVTCSPDGKWALAATGQGKTICVWNLETRTLAGTIPLPEPVSGIDVDPENRVIAAACNDGKVRLVPLDPSAPDSAIQELAAPSFAARPRSFCVEFSHDGRLVAAGYKNHTVRIWNIHQRKVVADLRTLAIGTENIVFSPDDQYLIAAGTGGPVSLIHIDSGRTVAAAPVPPGDGWGMAVSPTQPLLLTGGGSVWANGGWQDSGDFAIRQWRMPGDRELPAKVEPAPYLVQARSLQEIPAAGRVVAIDLQGSEWWSDKDMTLLRGLESLNSLDLDETPVSSAGVAQLGPLPRLETLSLNRTAVADPLPSTWAGQLPALKVLELKGTGVGDDALPAIGQLAQLQTLQLGSSRVADGGLVHLKAMPRLADLDLSRTAVSHAGLEQLETLPRLQRLGLSGTRLTQLAALTPEQFPFLEEIDLLDTPLDQEQLVAFQSRRPRLRARTGDGPVQVLELVDPTRDAILGNWTQTEQGLQIPVAKPARLGLPIRLPDEFDLRARVRGGGKPASGPVFGLPLPDGTRVLVGFDHWPKEQGYVIIHGIDGKMERESPAKTQQRTFPVEEVTSVELEIQVRRDDDDIFITALVDGEPRVSWQGLAARLDPSQWWFSENEVRPTLSQVDAGYLVEELTVTPVTGRIGLPDAGPTHADPDRQIAEALLHAHGAVRVILGQPNETPILVESASELPARPFWVHWLRTAGEELDASWFETVGRLEHLEGLMLNHSHFVPTHIAPLARLTRLKRIDAWNTSLDDEGLKILAELPRLEELRFGRTSVTDEGFAYLAEHPNMEVIAAEECAIGSASLTVAATIPNLQVLLLRSTAIKGDGLAALTGKASLRQLQLNHCAGLRSADLRSLASLPNLSSLSLAGSQDDPREVFDALGQIKSLQSLSLLSRTVSAADLERLTQLTQLRELNLENCRLNDAAILPLAEMTQLEQLDLRGNPELTSQAISTLLQLRSLTELQLDQENFTTEDLAALRHQIPKCRLVVSPRTESPTTLDLTGQNVTDATLRDTIGQQRPAALVLEGPGITDASMPLVASLSSLKRLEFRGTSVTNDGLELLKELPLIRLELWNMPQITEPSLESIAAMPRIQFLALKSTGVFGPGLERMHGRLRGLYMAHPELGSEVFRQYILPFENLEQFDMAGARITDEDMILMSEHLKEATYVHFGFNSHITGSGLGSLVDLPCLRALQLSYSNVDDQGLRNLRGAGQIQSLGLRRTRVTDACIDTLVSLSNLTSLDISDTKITAAGVARLAAEMPAVQVTASHLSQTGGADAPRAAEPRATETSEAPSGKP